MEVSRLTLHRRVHLTLVCRGWVIPISAVSISIAGVATSCGFFVSSEVSPFDVCVTPALLAGLRHFSMGSAARYRPDAQFGSARLPEVV